MYVLRLRGLMSYLYRILSKARYNGLCMLKACHVTSADLQVLQVYS